MTTGITLVRSDMKNAITLHAPPSPIPEEPTTKVSEVPKHAAALWDPWHELGLYDPIRSTMPCLGREPSKNGAPCRWEVDSENSVGITAALAKLAQTVPHDVNDNDLDRLLNLGICSNHAEHYDEVKSQGLKWLQYRLNIARMHHERIERLTDDVRKLRAYIQQLQISMSSGGTSAQGRHHDWETDQLRSRINQLEHATVLARMETEKVEADAIDREAKLDRDVQERDDKIEVLNHDNAVLRSQLQGERQQFLDQIQQAGSKAGNLEEQSSHKGSDVENPKQQSQIKEQEAQQKDQPGMGEERPSWRKRLRAWFRRKRKKKGKCPDAQSSVICTS